MREYIRPTMQGEMFAANEYIAACWGVNCSTDAANTVEKNWYWGPWWRPGKSNYELGQTHDLAHCGKLTNQWVIDDDGDGIIDRMVETGTDGLGDLNCVLYKDANYETGASFDGVGIRSYIYWTTSSGDRTWHHQGTVVGTDPSHPNRS